MACPCQYLHQREIWGWISRTTSDSIFLCCGSLYTVCSAQPIGWKGLSRALCHGNPYLMFLRALTRFNTFMAFLSFKVELVASFRPGFNFQLLCFSLLLCFQVPNELSRCVIRSGPRGVQLRRGEIEADPFVIQENLLKLHVFQVDSHTYSPPKHNRPVCSRTPYSLSVCCRIPRLKSAGAAECRLYVQRSRTSIAVQAAAAAWRLGVPWSEAIQVATNAVAAAGVRGAPAIRRAGRGKGKGKA